MEYGENLHIVVPLEAITHTQIPSSLVGFFSLLAQCHFIGTLVREKILFIHTYFTVAFVCCKENVSLFIVVQQNGLLWMLLE
jgi:hypothetical protein